MPRARNLTITAADIRNPFQDKKRVGTLVRLVNSRPGSAPVHLARYVHAALVEGLMPDDEYEAMSEFLDPALDEGTLIDNLTTLKYAAWEALDRLWSGEFFSSGSYGLVRLDDGRVELHMQGLFPDPDERFLIRRWIARLEPLVQAQWPIRRCALDSCRRYFIPKHGNQHYHARTCSDRARRVAWDEARKRGRSDAQEQRSEARSREE